MRCSFPVSVRPLPISQIPLSSLRLPPRPTPLPNLQSTSPTLSKLLSNLSTPSTSADKELPEDGRGLGGFTLRKQGKGGSVPGNLRVEEYVEKRREFEGVSRRHRDLVRYEIGLFQFSLFASRITDEVRFTRSFDDYDERHKMGQANEVSEASLQGGELVEDQRAFYRLHSLCTIVFSYYTHRLDFHTICMSLFAHRELKVSESCEASSRETFAKLVLFSFPSLSTRTSTPIQLLSEPESSSTLSTRPPCPLLPSHQSVLYPLLNPSPTSPSPFNAPSQAPPMLPLPSHHLFTPMNSVQRERNKICWMTILISLPLLLPTNVPTVTDLLKSKRMTKHLGNWITSVQPRISLPRSL